LCIISELNLPGIGGLDLQRSLQQRGHEASFIFAGREVSVRDAVRAMQCGAVTVLEKQEGVMPVVVSLSAALQTARQRLAAQRIRREVLEDLQSLNEGEYQVLSGILEGQLNKEIAHHLNLSIRTIEQRRRQIFRKLKVQHPASLAQKVIQVVRPGPLPSLQVLRQAARQECSMHTFVEDHWRADYPHAR
jgi:two-component system response regulator FixJ